MANNGPYYPKGSYKGTITEQALTKSEGGSSYVALKMKINGAAVGLEDYERTIKLYITDAAVAYTVEKLRAIGYDRHNFKEIDPSTPGYFEFEGIEASVYCKHEVGQNGTGLFEKWDISTPKAGRTIEPLEPKALRELDNLFGKAFKAAPVATATRPAQAPQPARGFDPGISDDDVPF